MHRDAFVAK